MDGRQNQSITLAAAGPDAMAMFDPNILAHLPVPAPESVSISITMPAPEEKRTDSPYRSKWFVPATCAIYFAGDLAWQLAFDAINCNYVLSCFVTGTAQAIASYATNSVTASFNITDHWGPWEVASSFLSGALWLPFVIAGQPPIATAITLGALNTVLLKSLEYLRACSNPPQENTEAATEKRIPSKTADSFSAVAFYTQGLFCSPAGTRSALWGGALSGAAAAIGEVASKPLSQLSALAANSFWKCVGSCKSSSQQQAEVAADDASGYQPPALPSPRV